MIVPVSIHNASGIAKFAVSKRGVDISRCNRELVEDPALCKGYFGRGAGGDLRFEGGRKFAENVFRCLVDLIAKTTVAMHNFGVEVDVAT